MKGAKTGKRHADLLIKAYFKNGQDVWLLIYIDAAEKKLHDEIITYEEDQKMPYITTAERIAIKKGMNEGIKEGVE